MTAPQPPPPPSATPRAVAPGWTEHVDARSGQRFYHHAKSGASQWRLPPAVPAAASPARSPPSTPAAPPPLQSSPQSPALYAQAGHPQHPHPAPPPTPAPAPPPLPHGWTRHHHHDGRVYYYCKETGATRWDHPLQPQQQPQQQPPQQQQHSYHRAQPAAYHPAHVPSAAQPVSGGGQPPAGASLQGAAVNAPSSQHHGVLQRASGGVAQVKRMAEEAKSLLGLDTWQRQHQQHRQQNVQPQQQQAHHHPPHHAPPQHQQYAAPPLPQHPPPQHPQHPPPQHQQHTPSHHQQYAAPQHPQHPPPQHPQHAPPQHQQHAPTHHQQYATPQHTQHPVPQHPPHAPPQHLQHAHSHPRPPVQQHVPTAPVHHGTPQAAHQRAPSRHPMPPPASHPTQPAPHPGPPVQRGSEQQMLAFGRKSQSEPTPQTNPPAASGPSPAESLPNVAVGVAANVPAAGDAATVRGYVMRDPVEYKLVGKCSDAAGGAVVISDTKTGAPVFLLEHRGDANRTESRILKDTQGNVLYALTKAAPGTSMRDRLFISRSHGATPIMNVRKKDRLKKGGVLYCYRGLYDEADPYFVVDGDLKGRKYMFTRSEDNYSSIVAKVGRDGARVLQDAYLLRVEPGFDVALLVALTVSIDDQFCG